MATLAETLVSSSSRKLPVRMRPDLEARPQRYQGRLDWVVKDPIALNYFRFEREEFAILSMLDGETSLDEIKARFEAQFPPQKIALDELQRLIGMLHRSGLVLADAPGQGDQLRRRSDERRRKERIDRLTNVLAIRFKGFDPDPILAWLHPKLRWLFATPTVLLACCLALVALALVTVQFDVFRAKLPTFGEFFAAENWIWMALTLALTKVLHEFGHGVAAKHFGGECHEMGVMVLVLTPCLYCNVSDSWMLGNKWHRAAIGAAGMYVEIVLASIATFLWWFSEPGLFNSLCLSTMFVCSVSTIVFNGNPLLRYDGYYILSDVLEIPNLRQKATTLLNRKLGAWCLGLAEPDDPFLPKRHQTLFALYSVAAAVYRWVVTFSILWFLYKLFQPYRLEIVGQMIGLAALYGLLVRPLWQLFKFFHVPGRIYQVKRNRMALTVGGLALVLLAILLLPLPSAVYCTLEIQPRGAVPVYVDVPGQLAEVFVRAGQPVAPGEPLGRLENVDVHLAIARLSGERDQFRSQLASLQQQRFRDDGAAMEIDRVRQSLAALEEQLHQKTRDVKRLALVAPVAGAVLPPPPIPHQTETDDELPAWSGTPLETKNLGATLGESTLFCQIGDPRSFEAILIIDQADIERIREGQSVEIELDQLSGQRYAGRIEQVARRDLEVSSQRLSSKSGGRLATKTDAAGMERPMSTSYQALVPLHDDEGILRIGLVGQAKIHSSWQTLGSRAWRSLMRTFNFRL